jgi:hypothetical protein
MGVTLLEDVARREANHAYNERQHALRSRRQLRSTTWVVARVWAEETLSE